MLSLQQIYDALRQNTEDNHESNHAPDHARKLGGPEAAVLSDELAATTELRLVSQDPEEVQAFEADLSGSTALIQAIKAEADQVRAEELRQGYELFVDDWQLMLSRLTSKYRGLADDRAGDGTRIVIADKELLRVANSDAQRAVKLKLLLLDELSRSWDELVKYYAINLTEHNGPKEKQSAQDSQGPYDPGNLNAQQEVALKSQFAKYIAEKSISLKIKLAMAQQKVSLKVISANGGGVALLDAPADERRLLDKWVKLDDLGREVIAVLNNYLGEWLSGLSEGVDHNISTWLKENKMAITHQDGQYLLVRA